MRYLILVLFLLSCGDYQGEMINSLDSRIPKTYVGQPDRLWASNVDVASVLKPYFNRMVDDLMDRKISIYLALNSIRFGTTTYNSVTDTSTLAECQVEQMAKNNQIVNAFIVFDPVQWEEYRSNTKAVQWVMSHELGHCLLNQDHVGGKLDVMNPYIPVTADLSLLDWDRMNEIFLARGRH